MEELARLVRWSQATAEGLPILTRLLPASAFLDLPLLRPSILLMMVLAVANATTEVATTVTRGFGFAQEDAIFLCLMIRALSTLVPLP